MAWLDQLAALKLADIGAVVYVGFSTARGLARGMTMEAARLICLATAFGLALLSQGLAGEWLLRYTRLRGQAATACGFTVVLLLSLAALWLALGMLRHTVLKKVNAKLPRERVGGCVVGFVRAWVAAVLFFAVMIVWPHEFLNRAFGSASILGQALLRAIPSLQHAEAPEAVDAPAAAEEAPQPAENPAAAEELEPAGAPVMPAEQAEPAEAPVAPPEQLQPAEAPPAPAEQL